MARTKSTTHTKVTVTKTQPFLDYEEVKGDGDELVIIFPKEMTYSQKRRALEVALLRLR